MSSASPIVSKPTDIKPKFLQTGIKVLHNDRNIVKLIEYCLSLDKAVSLATILNSKKKIESGVIVIFKIADCRDAYISMDKTAMKVNIVSTNTDDDIFKVYSK